MRSCHPFILFAMVASAASGHAAETASDPTLGAAFFAQHCRACHVGTMPKGDFSLDKLTSDFGDEANRERWLAVVEQLREGTMPPPDKAAPAGGRRRGTH